MTHSIDDLPGLLVEQLPRASHEARSATQDELETMRADVDASTFSGAVSLGEALQLYSLVRELRPETTLEIGMFTAASTLAILKALRDNERGTHYVCDPFQSTYAQNAGLRNVEESGLGDRMRFVEAFPEEAAPGWPTAEFAFIDGSHLFDLTILDFVLVDKRLAPGGLVGLHDLWMPSLQKVVRWAVTNRGYEVVTERRAPLGRRQRARSLLARFLRRVPDAERIFAPELLRPWHEIEPSGAWMIFLRKTRGDDRDWRDHEPF
jgi:predicted O-methyltransferase YrrM